MQLQSGKRLFEFLGDLTLRGKDTQNLDKLTHRRIREVTVVILAVTGVGIPFVVQYALLNVPIMAAFVACTIAAGVLNLVLLRRTQNPKQAGLIGTIVLTMLLLASNWCSGGFYDPNFGWLYVLPIIAALMISSRTGWIFTVIIAVLTLGFWMLPLLDITPPNLIPKEKHAIQSLANRLSAIATIGIFLWALRSQREFLTARWAAANEALRQEIEHRKQLQQNAEAAQQNAESANEAKNRFLANLSHELRTPLNAIIGYTEMIQDDHEHDDMLVEDTNNVLHSAQDLLKLINNVLDLTNLERGRMKPTYQRMALPHFIEQLAHDMTPLVTQRGNTFEHHMLTQTAEIQCDPHILKQILVGLLNNAGKFTHQGAVTLRVQEDETSLIFEVQDTGIGMSPAEAEHIFETFTQADDSATRQYGGLGLGLALCSKLAHVLNGQLDVTSVKHQGSTFRLTLPQINAQHANE